MGSFYTNITLRGPTQHEVADYLIQADRIAYVSPTVKRITVVYDADSESQDTSVMGRLASELSNHFQCPSLAILNHDDDLLVYQLYEAGKLIDEYDSSPGYFDGELSAPIDGDAKKLGQAFDVKHNIAQIESILRKPSYEEDGYLFATDRHRELAQALGIPSFAVGLGYEYIEARDIPDLDYTNFVKTVTES